MNFEKENIKTIEKKLEKMNSHIDEYQEKLEHFPKTVNNELKLAIMDLKTKKGYVEEKLETLKDVSGNAYVDVKSGAEMAWNDLTFSFENAKQRFRDIV